MKRAIVLSIFVFFILLSVSSKLTAQISAKVAPAEKDSTEYELVIIDIHFDQWYLLNYNEAKDRSDEYYHSKNLVAAQNWNDYYRRGEYINVVDSYLNYLPGVDYGIELNRKLYWYFKFVEDYYKVKLWW